MKISEIHGPEDIKEASIQELEELAQEIRTFLIQNIARTGGHLSSNLGIVELTIAVHKVFDSPTDRILFDVGHQSYVHKILTGRADKFYSLRQLNGISGFQKKCESEHDVWEAGHSSTALSAALGFCIARDLNHEHYQVVPIVGDASIVSGISLEALNTIGMKQPNMVIILNDNDMSISKNVGALSETFTKLRTSKPYNSLKSGLSDLLNNNDAGKNMLHKLKDVKDSLKKSVVESSFFGDFGLDYIGPVNGHDLKALIQTLEIAKNHHGPIVVHVCTIKGKGYSFAENDKSGKWHGIGPFNIRTGETLSQLDENTLSWSEAIAQILYDIAKTNKDVVTITPAMTSGSKLEKIAAAFPNRFIDCGIAEDHAAVLAAGLASEGKHPFLSIYSTFLQRAYDPINHDIARMNLPVVIAIDRAGLVGEDGPTHHGVFDIQLLRALPNVILAQPSTYEEAVDLMHLAFSLNQPFALRYPRGNVTISDHQPEKIAVGSWTYKTIGSQPKCIIIAYGNEVEAIKQKAKANEFDMIVVNARFFKPLDTACIQKIAQQKLPVYVHETDMLAGGLSSAILEYCNDADIDLKLHRIGIGDHYVHHGSVSALRKLEGLDLNSLFDQIEEFYHAH